MRKNKLKYVRHLINQFVILSRLLEIFSLSNQVNNSYFWQEEIQQIGLILETWHSQGYGDQMEGHLLIL